jgi:hypothetical protein
MKTGYLRQDDSGHWYVVPEEEVEKFDATMRAVNEVPEHSEAWYIRVDGFIALYEEYRLSGGYQDQKVLMD